MMEFPMVVRLRPFCYGYLLVGERGGTGHGSLRKAQCTSTTVNSGLADRRSPASSTLMRAPFRWEIHCPLEFYRAGARWTLEGGLGRYENLASVTPVGADLNITAHGNNRYALTSTMAALGEGNVTVKSIGRRD